MIRNLFATATLAVATLAIGLAGCSATGAGWEAVRLGKNASSKSSNLKIMLDGQEAKQNKLKKAYFGHASFKISEPVSTAPSFQYDFIDPAKFGRITNVSMQIHQEHEGDFSHQAEFVIYPANPNDSTTLLQPKSPISLGALPSNMKCMNFEKQAVSGVQLKPGLEYMLVFTVSGDRSESVQVLFETR